MQTLCLFITRDLRLHGSGGGARARERGCLVEVLPSYPARAAPCADRRKKNLVETVRPTLRGDAVERLPCHLARRAWNILCLALQAQMQLRVSACPPCHHLEPTAAAERARPQRLAIARPVWEKFLAKSSCLPKGASNGLFPHTHTHKVSELSRGGHGREKRATKQASTRGATAGLRESPTVGHRIEDTEKPEKGPRKALQRPRRPRTTALKAPTTRKRTPCHPTALRT